MSSKIRGVVPPLAIPLKDGELDVPSLERHINRMIDAGLDGLFVSGSTGEVAFSTAERRAQIQREAVRIVDGRIPLLVGVIDTETERVIENIKAVEEIGGATGVVATAPFYALGGETEVERHFRLLKENTSLELWAYDIPVCVHTKLSPDLLMRLGRDGVIDGVKDSSGDDVAFRWLCLANEAAGHPMQLLTGHEVVVDGAYMSGADGSVPGLANVDPEGYVRQWQAYERRDWEAVRTEQDRLAELMRIVQVKGVQGFGAGVGGFSPTGLVGCTTSAGRSFRTTAFTLGGGVLAGFSCTGLGFSGACGGGGGGAGCSWAGCAAPPFSRGAGAPSASGLSSPSGVPKSTKVNSSTVTGSGGSLLFHASAKSPACSKLTTIMTEGFKRL